MARGNESSSSSESDSDDDLPSYNTIVQQNLKYARVCTSQQKKLKNLKEELGSSQEAYKNLLEQYETLQISMLNYLLKLSNLRLVQQQMNAQSMISNLKRKMKN